MEPVEIYRGIFIRKLVYEDKEMIGFASWQSKSFKIIMDDLHKEAISSGDPNLKDRIEYLKEKLIGK